MTTLNFPDDFWWGAATSGPQTEGRFKKTHANIFDYEFEIKPEQYWHGIDLIRHRIFTMIIKMILH